MPSRITWAPALSEMSAVVRLTIKGFPSVSRAMWRFAPDDLLSGVITPCLYTWRRRLRQDLADQGFVEAAMEAEPIKEEAPSDEVIVVEMTGSGRIRICGSAPPCW